MKKILYSVFSALVLLSIVGCSDNEEFDRTGGAPNGKSTIMASTETSIGQRTALSGDDENGYNVVWSEGDKLSIMGTSNNFAASDTYILQDGENTTDGQFVSNDGRPIDWTRCNKVEATYGLVDGKWPSTQKYQGEDIISNAPMYCNMNTYYSVPSLKFKNMGGILRLKLKGYSTIKRIEITSPNQDISGTITYNSQTAFTVNGGNTIKLEMDKYVDLSLEGKLFNIAMPEGKYSDVQIKIVDDIDNEFIKTLKNDRTLDITRSQITNVSFTLTLNKSMKDGSIGLYEGLKVIMVKAALRNSVTAWDVENLKANMDDEWSHFESWRSGCWVFRSPKAVVSGKWHAPGLNELHDINALPKERKSIEDDSFVLRFDGHDHKLIFPFVGMYQTKNSRYQNSTRYYWTNYEITDISYGYYKGNKIAIFGDESNNYQIDYDSKYQPVNNNFFCPVRRCLEMTE